MHAPDTISLPDIDNGLHLIRWKARGFDEMRRIGLISHKAEFELVEGMILEREFSSPRHERVVAELARRLKAALRGAPWTVRVDKELRLEAFDSVVSPDISVGGRTGP